MSIRAAFVVALLLAGSGFPARAADEPQVVRVKGDVVLRGQGGDQLTVKREEFKGAWPVRAKNDDGTYVVEVDGKRYTVDPWLVEVKGMKQLVATPTQTCLDSKDPRVAGTRNVGECRK